MRLISKVAVLAAIASLSVAGAAFAGGSTLKWKEARKLANKLARQEAQKHKVDHWRIFGGQRISKREIDYVYNVDYSDGTLCDAQIRVKIVNPQTRLVRAKFTDVHDGAWWNERGKTGARIVLPLELRLDCFGMGLGDVIRQCRATGIVSKHMIHQVGSGQNRKPGMHTHIDVITRDFTEELANLKLEWGDKNPPTFHEIRSLSERLYATQGDVNTQELLGHKDPRTTATYHDGRGEWVRVGIRKTTV